jgi:hypothetical protein
MKLRSVTLAALLCAAVFSSAQAADAAKPSDPAPGSDDETVCTYEQTTGSHLGHRVCMTRAQRKQRSEEDQKAMESMRSHSGSGKAPAGTTQ